MHEAWCAYSGGTEHSTCFNRLIRCYLDPSTAVTVTLTRARNTAPAIVLAFDRGANGHSDVALTAERAERVADAMHGAVVLAGGGSGDGPEFELVAHFVDRLAEIRQAAEALEVAAHGSGWVGRATETEPLLMVPSGAVDRLMAVVYGRTNDADGER
jgi:hypothetical protein